MSMKQKIFDTYFKPGSDGDSCYPPDNIQIEYSGEIIDYIDLNEDGTPSEMYVSNVSDEAWEWDEVEDANHFWTAYNLSEINLDKI